MPLSFVSKNLLVVTALITLLSACDNNSNHHETNYPIDSIVQLDKTQNINQSIDLLLHYPFDTVTDINWRQSAGEPVTILAKTSKVISFTPTLAGEYAFTVSFTLNNGSQQTLAKNITVNDDFNNITARLSHSALSDNKVSFRSELHSSVDITTLQWQQIEGPFVTLTSGNSNGELAVFFDAPQVDFDTIITFNITATNSSNNAIYNDQVAVLVEPANEINSNAYFSDRNASAFPYNTNSPYAQNIVDCVYSNALTSSCALAKIPLLAEEVKGSSAILSVDTIMDRVVVSHQWMGDRFKDFLINDDVNNDIKNLLRATTAIVIAYDVRPSFYWAATGAIYLDAENLWLTPQERDTINEAPDFRADFGKDLQFVMPWRYVKDNDYASQSYDKADRVTRSSADGLYRLTSLMYHELAHANDFFPSNEWYIHSNNQRILDAALSSDFESDQLAITLPLASQEMRNLAQVSFAGEAANQIQKNYQPSDIELYFRPDRATDFYAYSSLREDYAMLFEELMMQYRFGVIRDVAITNQPTGNNISASDYIVTWGQRGRIGDDKLTDRVLFSAIRVLPEFDSQTAIATVPMPIEMVSGNSWLGNLAISSTETDPTLLMQQFKGYTLPRASSTSSVERPLNNVTRYYEKPLPKG
ncbi:hypothetical protein [Colwellia psychrerythraea]|uniref:Lipoprotein n=1 Tax=Colwellia psychrerythraea TaxID=28229 RepID=A0A099KAP3_COLPS|nr:hypothetical protein [Colwellia psychrerythraea]KGJ87380.1 hypothetical protein GAB14E_4535 [Colwellia psychrerythraea]